MIKFLRRFWSMLFDYTDDSPTLDHVPVNGTISARKFSKARQQAELRHGKKFATDILKPRETAKSRDLLDIERAAPIVREAVITKIVRGVK